MSTTYTIWPLRFSAQPAAMIAFLRDLGLQQRVGHENGTWGVFAGSSGTLAVHDTATAETAARSGDTSFNFTAADLDAAAHQLRAGGLQVDVWDEAYGRQARAVDASGWEVGLNEDEQDDLHGGYLAYPDGGTNQTTAASMEVMAICFTDRAAEAAAFYGAFGFAAEGAVQPAWTLLRGERTAGLIGLHAPDENQPNGSWTIAFATSEPLDAVAARLSAAGHPASVVTDSAGPHVDVVDPDGVRLEIHPN